MYLNEETIMYIYIQFDRYINRYVFQCVHVTKVINYFFEFYTEKYTFGPDLMDYSI